MNIDMSYFEFYKSPRAFAPGLSTLLVLGIIGCDGGMIGTGSGPVNSIYELENLPKRISPDIPKTLLKGEELAPSDNTNNDTKERDVSQRDQIINSDKSQGWAALNDKLSLVAFLRLNVESNATIIDLAFDDILIECAEQLLDCTIPADRIRVTITQDVVNRLVQLHTDWAQSTPSFSVSGQSSGTVGDVSTTISVSVEEQDVGLSEMIETQFNSLVNTEVVLGETHYSQLDGAPYDHAIRTFIKRGADQSDEFSFLRWADEDFSVRWHEDGHVANFTTGATQQTTQEYFYQNKVPSELVISNVVYVNDDGTTTELYARILGNNPDQAGILVEAASASSVYGASSGGVAVTTSTGLAEPSDGQNSTVTQVDMVVPVDGIETETSVVIDTEATSFSFVERSFEVFQGQLDNSGGYSTLDGRQFDLSAEQNLTFFEGYRDSYDKIGRLLAGELCIFDVLSMVNLNCNDDMFESYGPVGSSITDSVHYFTSAQFDTLAASQDAIRWKVEGVPGKYKSIAVVSAESQNDLAESKVLCRGLKYVAEDAYIFCTATDEQLGNTVVVEQVDGVLTSVIPTAKLVQVQ